MKEIKESQVENTINPQSPIKSVIWKWGVFGVCGALAVSFLIGTTFLVDAKQEQFKQRTIEKSINLVQLNTCSSMFMYENPIMDEKYHNSGKFKEEIWTLIELMPKENTKNLFKNNFLSHRDVTDVCSYIESKHSIQVAKRIALIKS